jgi:dephospho-CoA kinase
MLIGLTGGIGSGKTIVSKLFEMFGAKVFYSDECAKSLYFKNEIKQQIIKLLGKEAYLNDNTLNKKYISNTIFTNTDLLARLNKIIHPAVAEEFKHFAKSNEGALIIKESALLFETGLFKQLDKTILVTTPLDLRIARIMERDNLTKEQVILKMKSQMSDEEKLKLADFVINNNEKDFLITQSLSIFHQLNNA